MKDFLQKFITEKIAVHCDEEWKADKFMKWCDENGIGWKGDKTVYSKNYWFLSGHKTVYSYDENHLATQSVQSYIIDDYTIIKWEDIFDMTVSELEAKFEKILNELGLKNGNCSGVDCKNCVGDVGNNICATNTDFLRHYKKLIENIKNYTLKEEQITEVTLEEIAKLKGVAVENLRIKEK